MSEKLLTGIPTAPGIALGKVYLFRHDEPVFREFCVAQSKRMGEISRLVNSVEQTKRQLFALSKRLSDQVGVTVAEIFEAQAAFLDDEMFIGEIRNQILDQGINTEAAVQRTTDSTQKILEALDNDVFRQRARDVQDIGRRIIRNLLGTAPGALEKLNEEVILVADDLLPSDVVHLLNDFVLAIVTDQGGAATHTAILTRSLEVPAVVGLGNLSRLVKNGDAIIVNGNSGKVIVKPRPETVQNYLAKRERYEKYAASLSNIDHLPAETTDGKQIRLRLNLELSQEVKNIKTHGAEGVGLFRSEYLFLTANQLPSELEQLEEYQKVIRTFAPHPVTIRTFDLGGDKVFQDLPHPQEANPFMGWRAIRVSLDQLPLFQTQLRAILRASVAGPTKIMFPFISGLGQVRKVKREVEIVKTQLDDEGHEFDRNIKLGVMIELPSAVLMADKLAQEVDFFSIGTNDLTQFVLAVDRGNEFVRRYYQPLHPAVLKMIKMTIDAGHAAGIPVGLCGEMAANPMATMLLVGLGLDELSVSPVAISEVKKIIRTMTYADAKEFALKALTYDTAESLNNYCLHEVKKLFADLPIWFNGDVD